MFSPALIMNICRVIEEKSFNTHKQSKTCLNIACDEANNPIWVYINQLCTPGYKKEESGGEAE